MENVMCCQKCKADLYIHRDINYPIVRQAYCFNGKCVLYGKKIGCSGIKLHEAIAMEKQSKDFRNKYK